MVGYFAFPPLGFTPYPAVGVVIAQESQESDPQTHPPPTAGSDRAWEDKQKRDAELRYRKLQQEQEQALEGEMDWVRAGGWLRDAYGRKDTLRTERLRAEARVRDERRKILAQWQAYEDRWRALLASTEPVSFEDIPWPTSPLPTSVDNLTPDAVVEFFLARLQVDKQAVPKKQLIRTSLLRWHPDKLCAVLARTVEQDLDSVRSGINAVFRILRSMQDLERQPDTH